MSSWKTAVKNHVPFLPGDTAWGIDCLLPPFVEGVLLLNGTLCLYSDYMNGGLWSAEHQLNAAAIFQLSDPVESILLVPLLLVDKEISTFMANSYSLLLWAFKAWITQQYGVYCQEVQDKLTLSTESKENSCCRRFDLILLVSLNTEVMLMILNIVVFLDSIRSLPCFLCFIPFAHLKYKSLFRRF